MPRKHAFLVSNTMRIIARKVQNHWSAQFEDDPAQSSDGPDAIGAIRHLLLNSAHSQITIYDLKPDFSASGLDCLVMVLDKPCPKCGGTGKCVVANQEETCPECSGKGHLDEEPQT
jgi:hypothetical protein